MSNLATRRKKGRDFEKLIARLLSMWWTRGRDDTCFTRSEDSGSAGQLRHLGDIAPVVGDAYLLTDVFVFECKRINNVNWPQFLYEQAGVEVNSPLTSYYEQAAGAAGRTRNSMVVFQEDRRPKPLVFWARKDRESWTDFFGHHSGSPIISTSELYAVDDFERLLEHSEPDADSIKAYLKNKKIGSAKRRRKQ